MRIAKAAGRLLAACTWANSEALLQKAAGIIQETNQPHSQPRQRFFPGQRGVHQLSGQLRIGIRDVAGFIAIRCQIIKFHMGAVVIDEQFPFSFPNGEVRTAIISGPG